MLVAYEPPSNDRNRLKSLLGVIVFEATFQEKYMDLKNSVARQEHARIYLRGLRQNEVYDFLLQVGSNFFLSQDIFYVSQSIGRRTEFEMSSGFVVLFQSILLNKSM